MPDAAEFARALIGLGYSAYPASVSIDEQGDKLIRFRDGKWAAGEYPTDPAEITQHWDGWDGLMINTGRSGLVVVDIDVKKGKDGFASLRSKGINLPDTPVKAKTPSGGEHWFYREPEGQTIPSSSDVLAEGVDIRARGGLVLSEPSEIEGVGRYSFNGRPVEVAELPEFPRELAMLLSPRKGREIATSDEKPMLTPEQRERMEDMLDRILRELASMEDGTRNATMRARLNRLFGIAKSLGYDLDLVAAMVREAYVKSGGTSERELESFIDWAVEHSKFEVPQENTDEDFEAEVALQLRRIKVREEADKRANPVRARGLTDDDVLEFDPETLEDDEIITGVIPRDETVIMFGTPNAGKSFAAIDLACGMATETRAWNESVAGGKVLYLAGEGTRRLMLRKRAWEEMHGREVPSDRVQFRRMRLRLADEKSVAEHAQLVSDFKADLIIVDTMLRAAEGKPLENPGEAASVIANLDRVREGNPGATLLVLHHPSKSNPDAPAGSFPIEGQVDTIIKLVNEEGFRTISLKKNKEGDTRWNQVFELADTMVTGVNRGSAVLMPSAGPPPEVQEGIERWHVEHGFA